MTHILNRAALALALSAMVGFTACASGGDKPAAKNAAPIPAMDKGASLTVNVNGIASQSGYIMAALFKDEAGYKDRNPYQGQRSEITGAQAQITFTDLPPGDYAVTIFHDEDGDGKLARNTFGIPVEPYGFSNDAPVRYGPPKWSAAKFTVSGAKAAQTIHLK